MDSRSIRAHFCNFFIEHKHQKISSSSLVPENDPTLLFANAGMNQFKDIFTGKSRPEQLRAVTVQKCVRAGGKHNDLENVGFTARHHTFFEMLGNFSFGDYFKIEAIEFAWKFLTERIKFPANKLYVTVHVSDDEAFNIWHKHIGLPVSQIFRKGDKDNFWEMGEVGPCGPCSEIYYDHGPSFATPGFTPGIDQDILDDSQRYVEIWNLVFMQYERTKAGLTPLPKPSIDTGAGLERIAAAIQGKYWNYDTDLFAPIINRAERLLNVSYAQDKYKNDLRVIADHIRSSTMLITDGILPENEGRGYVLRRIIRRAIRHARHLGAKTPVLYQLVDAVFEILGEEYPQNKANAELARKILKQEEERFLETLDMGMKFLEDAFQNNTKIVNGKNVLSGEAIFKLYDTYGFPADLTQIICSERKISADLNSFEEIMNKRREDSRKTWKGGSGNDLQNYYALSEKFGDTEFLGYKNLKTESKLLHVEKCSDGTFELIFNTSPFYAESGGQAGDHGVILFKNEIIAQVFDTQKPVNGLFLHRVKSLQSEKFKAGEVYQLHVDESQRTFTARNHSATHLLQSALIKVLGNHIKQAGSMVGPNRLRFDFTHTQAVKENELLMVEQMVNEQIAASLPVNASIMSKDKAISKGAMALFGEKYGDQVRVLEMGNFSTELCGGTHVLNTQDIGCFTILFETSLSSGVRRIEACTSKSAIDYLKNRSNILKKVEKFFNTNEDSVNERLTTLSLENKDLRKKIEEFEQNALMLKAQDVITKTKILNDRAILTANLTFSADLRKISDYFFDKHKSGIIAIASSSGEKCSILIRSSDPKIFDAGKLFKEIVGLNGGKGGGKAEMAQGTCPPEKIEFILKEINRTIGFN